MFGWPIITAHLTFRRYLGMMSRTSDNRYQDAHEDCRARFSRHEVYTPQKKICLSGDYKSTVNQVIKREIYALPTPPEPFS